MERVATGIEGLDVLIKGGIPKGSTVLVSGGTGTGKTILATQFIYNGAVKYREAGLYVTLETNLKNIVWNMENFNWDIESLQKKNLMKIYRMHLDKQVDIEGELEVITKMVEELEAKRLVVDSTTAFTLWIREPGELRRTVYDFTDALKELDCTTMLTSETHEDKNQFSAFGVEEFIADGVIALYFTPPHRSIFIRKMRGTSHSNKVHPLDITDKGISIRAKDEVMWEALR